MLTGVALRDLRLDLLIIVQTSRQQVEHASYWASGIICYSASRCAEPQLNDRFSLIVQFVTDIILVHGTAEIMGVPGDHQPALRKEVRAAVKQRIVHGMYSHTHEGVVIFVCRPIYDEHAEERQRQMAAIMNARWSGGPAPEVPSVRMSWCELTSD